LYSKEFIFGSEALNAVKKAEYYCGNSLLSAYALLKINHYLRIVLIKNVIILDKLLESVSL